MAYSKLCTQIDCKKPRRARGYCSTHYRTYMSGSLGSGLSRGELISRAKQAKKAKVKRDKQFKLMTEKTGGARHWNWKGGVSKERSIAYYSYEYKAWRSAVFQRDNYTCQVCNQYGGQLHADHIKSWAEFPDLRYELSNGRALCRVCHYYVTYKRKMPQYSKWGDRVRKSV